jgi:hypothetical protein
VHKVALAADNDHSVVAHVLLILEHLREHLVEANAARALL